MTIAFAAIVISGADHGNMMMTILSGAIFGSAFFVIAHLSRLTWLYYISIAWWLFEAWAASRSGLELHHVLLIAGMMFVFVFLPGLKLMCDQRSNG